MLYAVKRICAARKRNVCGEIGAEFAGEYAEWLPGMPVNIELAYALPEQQHLIELEVPVGTLARQAVLISGFDKMYPEIDLATIPIGIFGERVKDDQVLEEGDRVELYRPLRIDPMEARRRRAGGNG